MTWFEQMIASAKDIIRDGRPLAPVLFLKSRHGKIDIVPLAPVAQNKELMSEFLRWVVAKQDPAEYLLITESYVKVINQKDGGDQAVGTLLVDGTLQVSQLPSSMEAITVLYGDKTTERLGIVKFQRKGKRVRFTPIKWLFGDEMKGRFVNLREL